jgi:hypothetical protein
MHRRDRRLQGKRAGREDLSDQGLALDDPGKVSRNLNPAHKLLEGIGKLFGMAKVTGAATGRDFLRNHNHTRGVCWLGRSFLPTDFPNPDRPCERNPGPPTGVSSFQRRSRAKPALAA